MPLMKRLEDVLKEQGGNYILPFLWMHGEGKEVLKEELDKIRECGIREICVESRPHPDFLGSGWWEEMDFIMEEARRQEMKVWLLDDDKFPTGHANGTYAEYPELAEVYLAERHMDVLGPLKDSAVVIEPFLGADGELLAVLACPKPDTESLHISGDGIIDLTDKVYDGVVYFDIPKGYYRLFILYTTRKNGGREHYMNLIDTASVRHFVDVVYEAHYARYKADFGKTFAGFFSDEPEFGNTPGYDFQDKLGKRDVKLPWSQELKILLQEKWGDGYARNLPALWYGMGEKTGGIRYDYMDGVTTLVDRCFAGQVGRWCEEHGVSYIGHIIEDDNSHGRLGCSIGHFFRAQRGQDMSGIDVVLLQIMPGFTETYHQWIASDRDGEFFHFGLGKLGSSYAHIDPKKKGRAMCEIYGAYGWAEGVSLMKWLTDHMLVRGINVFVPHAFSPTFPDRDCPPHFYGRGNNPQFRFFAALMRYMNRVCHLLHGGRHTADAAVLYHADAEWSSGETMLFQKPVRILMESQLDCDVIPADLLEGDGTSIHEGVMEINGVFYKSLIIPYCEKIPQEVIQYAISAAERNLKVYIIDSLPKTTVHGEPIDPRLEAAVKIVPLASLGNEIRNHQETIFSIQGHQKDLRVSCYRQEEGNVYMFFNESVFEAVDVRVGLNLERRNHMIEYDGFLNAWKEVGLEDGKLQLRLMPGESKIFVSGGEGIQNKEKSYIRSIPIVTDWKISTSSAQEYPRFTYQRTIQEGEKLCNMNGKEGFLRFAGTFRYEGSLTLEKEQNAQYKIYLPAIGDCAEITINGEAAGMIIGAPYQVDITDFIKKGFNDITIDVTNTLVWKLHDGQSTHMHIYPTGLMEIPEIQVYQ